MPRLEIDDDPAFQERSWRVQRVGWVVILLIVTATALGFFGSGPLSGATVDAPSALSVHFQRFTRFKMPEELRLALRPPATDAAEVRVAVSRRFLESSEIQSIVPAPHRIEGAGDRNVYTFLNAAPGDRLDVVFNMRPHQIGRVHAWIGLEKSGDISIVPAREGAGRQEAA